MINNRTISTHCFNLLEHVECSGDIDKYLTAYQCPAGKWTIGMGNTYYGDGASVKKGDVITHQHAMDLFYDVIPTYEKIVNMYVLPKLFQCQFDALISFVYNVPRQQFTNSTLLKVINNNPGDPKIKDEWMKWVYFTNPQGQKEVSNGLKNRRIAETDLYFSF
jgi:lysozyme